MNTYLDKNLLPLMDGIKAKNTDSDILISLGLEHRGSTQSFVIQFGNRIEIFWNKVFQTLYSTTLKMVTSLKSKVKNDKSITCSQHRKVTFTLRVNVT